MDFVKFFTKEEQIAGLSVSENGLRLVLLWKDEKQNGKIAVKAMAEEPLAEGVVVNGSIKDIDAFTSAVRRLKDKVPYKITYVVLTLPQYLTYSKIFYFPKAITGEKLEETMRVTVGFSLPVKVEDIYLDWEQLDTERNELFLETIPRSVVDFYVKVLEKSEIRVIALESHYSSIIRAIDLKTAAPILLTHKENDRTSFVIVKNRIIRFTRTIPKKLEDKEFEVETKRIADFYEAEDMKIAEVISMDEAKIAPKFYEHPELREKSHLWLSVFGAAMRGLLPRSGDKLVSLMPIGSEKIYENQKALVFTKFTADVITGMSAFFTLAFFGALALSNSLASRIDTQLANLASLPLPQNALAVEERANTFNNLAAAIADIDKVSPRWSKVLVEIRARTIAGIALSGINMDSRSNVITINGTGRDRERINLFRKSIEESAMFSDIKLPITNLEQRINIPFSMSLRLKDPSILYSN